MTNIYDIIIVGSGLAGLYLGYNLLNYTSNICILEKKNRVSGRIKTVKNKNLIYDVGAGRISSKHKSLLNLIHKLKLDKNLIDIGNHSKNIINKINKKLLLNTKLNLQKKTVSDLLKNNISKNFYNNYGYYNNIKNQSGESFLLYSKNNYGKTFYILKNGLENITNKLSNKCKNIIKYNTFLKKVDSINNYFILEDDKKNNYKCKILILAIPKEELIKLKYLKQNEKIFDILNSVSHNNSYIRVFLQFPKKNNKIWFNNLNVKIHNTKLIRYLIPMDYKKGLIQLYSDGWVANNNLKLLMNNDNYIDILHKELKKLYKNKNIPKPIFRDQYYWKNGTHFWLPHKLSVNNRYNTVLQPFKNKSLFICGESYSKNQAWMEGALKTSTIILSKIKKLIKKRSLNKKLIKQNKIKEKTKIKVNKTKKIKLKPTNKSKRYKRISLIELKKHNRYAKKKWILIKKNIYDVTDWLVNHPGGAEILLNNSGTDATKKFISVGHSKRAKKLMRKFKIGVFKI